MLEGIEKRILFILGEILPLNPVNGILISNSSTAEEDNAVCTKPESSNRQILYLLVQSDVREMDLRVWLLAIIEDSSAPFRTVSLRLKGSNDFWRTLAVESILSSVRLGNDSIPAFNEESMVVGRGRTSKQVMEWRMHCGNFSMPKSEILL